MLTVEFTVLGIPCLGLNGGPAFKHTEAFSFQTATENQEETDHYWNAILGNGGTESACGLEILSQFPPVSTTCQYRTVLHAAPPRSNCS